VDECLAYVPSNFIAHSNRTIAAVASGEYPDTWKQMWFVGIEELSMAIFAIVFLVGVALLVTLQAGSEM
jgi:hypothetical protein